VRRQPHRRMGRPAWSTLAAGATARSRTLRKRWSSCSRVVFTQPAASAQLTVRAGTGPRGARSGPASRNRLRSGELQPHGRRRGYFGQAGGNPRAASPDGNGSDVTEFGGGVDGNTLDGNWVWCSSRGLDAVRRRELPARGRREVVVHRGLDRAARDAVAEPPACVVGSRLFSSHEPDPSARWRRSSHAPERSAVDLTVMRGDAEPGSATIFTARPSGATNAVGRPERIRASRARRRVRGGSSLGTVESRQFVLPRNGLYRCSARHDAGPAETRR